MLTHFPADPCAATEMPRADGTSRPGQFLDRFDDLIDDRIAELLDEREAQGRPRPRPRPAAAMLLIALTASVVLRHSALAVCAIWPSTAVVYLTAARAGMRRS
jgi:hypothetical protein